MDFDVHQHLDYGTDVDQYAARLRALKLRAGVSSCGPIFGQPGNDAVEAAFKKYPEQIVGFGYVPLGRGATPQLVRHLRQRGFRALKVIIPKKDYDDKSYYPIYAAAEKLKMPILFHTGVMARTEQIAARHANIPKVARVDHRRADISSKRMEPICLDAIARAFPDLTIIMAHFGSWGRREAAASVLAWNPNVYADLTYFVWHEHPKFTAEAVALLKQITSPQSRQRLLFGTDNISSGDMKWMPIFRKAIQHILKGVGLSKLQIRNAMGATAEELLAK